MGGETLSNAVIKVLFLVFQLISTIVYEDSSFIDLLSFQRLVFEKHFKCTSSVKDHEEQNHEKTDFETVKDKSDSEEKVNILETSKELFTSESKEAHIQTENSKTSNELKCPFNCEKASDNWTEDTIFAHIYTDHHKDVVSNYQLSTERFIKNLYQKISLKCSFNSDCNFSINKERRKGYTNYMQSINELKKHYYYVHVEDPKICDNCGKEFKNELNLKGHLRKSCNINFKDEQCQDCGKILKGSHNLNRHIRNFHLKKNQKICTKCDKVLYCSQALKQHISNIHEKLKSWVCDVCGTKMAQFCNLNDHRLKVHGAKFPSRMNYRSIISSGKHPFIKSTEEAHTYRQTSNSI